MDMHTQQEKASILLIYTGGTIGMIENPETGVLESFNFQHLKDNMPELKKLGYSVATIQFDPPMDSSEMGPDSVDEDRENHRPIIIRNTTASWYCMARIQCRIRHRH